MTDKVSSDGAVEVADGSKDLLKEVKEFALTVGEDCPEGHRRDPGSGRCLPMGSTDHTAFTRSLNIDNGPEWRGQAEQTIENSIAVETAVDADEMDQPESCAEGTTFSFVQRKCVSPEEAELENADEEARTEEDAAAPGQGGHPEITQMQPEGRRDTVNHACPPNQFFDYVRRECIPLNKDTVMASENEEFTDEFKKAVGTYANIAITSPDPLDGHRHVATLDLDGNGNSSISTGYSKGSYSHSHKLKDFEVADYKKEDYTSKHPGTAVPVEHEVRSVVDDYPMPATVSKEEAAPLKGGERKALPDSAFGVPSKRKFPLDTCGRVRNAMARFNQSKGLTSGEKATLRRKILARAKSCGVEVRKFAKAETADDFVALLQDLLADVQPSRLENYRFDEDKAQGPCPPGMVWAAESRRCTQMRGLIDGLKDEAQHSEIVKHQPEGRRDPVGFQCPTGWFFDFTNRRCLPLDPSQKPGSTTDKAEEENAQRDLAPSPAGKPAKLPQDCPAGTIWNGDRKECIPLDSRKKTKSEEDAAIPPQFIKNIKKKKDGDGKDGKKKLPPFIQKMIDKKKSKSADDEDAQTTAVGPGNTGGPGCPDGEFMNPITKKCMPRKGAFKKTKSDAEEAESREGLTADPAGRVKLPVDCPSGTAWNAVRRVCVPLDTRKKDRPSGASPQPSTNTAETETLSLAQIIKRLDEIIREEATDKEKVHVVAKSLPNAAFPPSLVSPTKRSLMHHAPGVEDPYDLESVDTGRLRNSLARAAAVEGFSEQAVEDAQEHLLYHARALITERSSKKD